ncbi:hypothetical protein JOS77_31390 [Chromobacterium haemolyticum]|nr:hypothetical protein JOS77_31390 [Chromobacterium haemolyticum]
MRAAGIPAAVSQSAGTFVCNHVFYGLMHALTGAPARGGFIHIPYLPEQAAAHPGAPSMSLEMIVAGLRLALETAWTATEDIVETGGGTRTRRHHPLSARSQCQLAMPVRVASSEPPT